MPSRIEYLVVRFAHTKPPSSTMAGTVDHGFLCSGGELSCTERHDRPSPPWSSFVCARVMADDDESKRKQLSLLFAKP